MCSGETDIAETVDDIEIQLAAEALGKLTGHIVNMDCDFFKIGNILYVLERV